MADKRLNIVFTGDAAPLNKAASEAATQIRRVADDVNKLASSMLQNKEVAKQLADGLKSNWSNASQATQQAWTRLDGLIANSSGKINSSIVASAKSAEQLSDRIYTLGNQTKGGLNPAFEALGQAMFVAFGKGKISTKDFEAQLRMVEQAVVKVFEKSSNSAARYVQQLQQITKYRNDWAAAVARMPKTNDEIVVRQVVAAWRNAYATLNTNVQQYRTAWDGALDRITAANVAAQKAIYASWTAGWANPQKTQLQQWQDTWSKALLGVQQQAAATQKAMFASWTSGWTNPQPSLATQFKTTWSNALVAVQQKQQQTTQAIAANFQQGFATAAANAQKVAAFTQSMRKAAALGTYGPNPAAAAMPDITAIKTANTELSKGNGLVSLFNTGLTGSIAKMGLYGAAAVKAFTLVKSTFDKIMGSYSKMGYDIYGLKLITNDTTEQVSELLYISQKFGVSSLSLQMRWAQAAKHLVDNNKWIRALGIEYKNLDGTTKPVINMLGEMGDKLNAMADSEKREAAAMAIFGRGYKDILPILVQGSAGMEKLRKEARKYGVVWSDDDLRKAREYDMNKRELAASFQGLTNILAQKFAPALSAATRKLAELVGSFTRAWKSSAGFRNGMKLLAIAFLMLFSPTTAFVALLVYLVQHFEMVGTVIVAVSEVLGNVIGKGVGVAAAAFKMLMDTVLEFAKGFLSVGEILTGNRFWKAVFGDGANEGIKAARASIDGFKIAMDKAVGGFAQSAWDNGGKWGKKFGEGAVSFIKKLKLPKGEKSDFNLGWAGGPEDPDPNAKGGGGGSKRNKLLEHFKQMVDASRASLNALIEEAKNAKKQMDDTAMSVRDALRGAFSIMELADETGGGRSGQCMFRLFQRRLDAMRGFVANLRKLRDMGVPADWLGEIANAGVDNGAQVARMLVSQPGVLAQMSELRTQMNVETQAAGEFVGQAMFGDKIADAISRSGAYQQQFQTLLLQGKKFGYKPTQEDIAVATQNIANSVYMTVGTNADPYAIEQAIAWALKTGVGGGYRRPVFAQSGGAPMSTAAPFFGGATLGNNQNVQMPSLLGPNP